MRRLLTGCTVSLAVFAGCNEPEKRVDASPPSEAPDKHESQGTLVYMVDNAMLADMSVNDAHFLPHRAHLNALGFERMSRLSQLVQAHGGSIRLNTDECEAGLTAQRMQAVRDFLSEAGVTVAGDAVVCDMPGGEGLGATEAISIRANEGTYKPGANKATSSGGGGGSKDSPDAPK